MTLFSTLVYGQKFLSLKRTTRSQEQSVIYDSHSVSQLTLCEQIFNYNMSDF